MSFFRVFVLVHVHLANRTDMEENLDRMLEKLDLILGVSRDCNFTLKRIESRDESLHINRFLVMMLEIRELLRMIMFPSLLLVSLRIH